MPYQLAMHRAYAPSHPVATGWNTRPARLTVRCRINLVMAQTQRLNDRLKTDAARGIVMALALSAGFWAIVGAAIVSL